MNDDDRIQEAVPIPGRHVLYGLCGPQPPAFLEGTEVLCDRCKKSKNTDGCGKVIPYVEYETLPTATITFEDTAPGNLDHIIAQHIENHAESKRLVRKWRVGHRLYIERWTTWDWTIGFGYIVDGVDKL